MGKGDRRRSNKMNQRRARAHMKTRMKSPLAERIKRAHRPRKAPPPPPPPAESAATESADEAGEAS